MSNEQLVRRFADAGLRLVLSDRPIVGGLGRGGSDIVQINVGRKTEGTRRREWFRLYPGAENNLIQVVAIDKKISQLVLLVREAEREFEEPVPWGNVQEAWAKDPENWIDILCRNGNWRRDRLRIQYHGKKSTPSVWSIRRTPPETRYMLLGVDERQLFIAQLPGPATSVREAHARLKTSTVTLAEGQGFKAARQGEWFFVEPTAEEVQALEYGLSKNLLVIEKTVPIGPFHDGSIGGRRRVRQFRGNPHTADELIVLPGRALDHGFPVRGREIFIRGRVRHIDHATVQFAQWRKVIRNNEPNFGNARGVGWVD